MTNINDVIRELKEYEEIKEQLANEIEQLKAQAIEYLRENGMDEVVTDDGKVTYREVIGRRFDTTSFKKDFIDIYEAYTKQTSMMRFTLN